MIPAQPVRISARYGIVLQCSEKSRETAHFRGDTGLIPGPTTDGAACPCVNLRFSS
jgi:hypothetical protein